MKVALCTVPSRKFAKAAQVFGKKGKTSSAQHVAAGREGLHQRIVSGANHYVTGFQRVFGDNFS